MSWNNALPLYIIEMEHEEREALMLCAMPEELNAGWVRSTPSYWPQIHKQFYQDES